MRDTQPSRREFLASGAVAAATATAVEAQGRQPVVGGRSGAARPARLERADPRPDGHGLRSARAREVQGRSAEHRADRVKTPDEFRRRLPEAEVVFGTLTGPDLPVATNVKWVQTGNAGVETLDREFMASPIALTNMARTFAPAISETAMGMLLCLTRGISKYYMPQFSKRQMNPMGTAKSDHHTELVGRTMGIVGMGGIGST